MRVQIISHAVRSDTSVKLPMQRPTSSTAVRLFSKGRPLRARPSYPLIALKAADRLKLMETPSALKQLDERPGNS
jgi:hypothetical protein